MEMSSANPTVVQEKANSRIKIAFVTHTLDTGGLERVIACLANNLDTSKFYPMVISLRKGANSENWINNDIPVIHLDRPFGNSIVTIAKLAKTLSKHHVDIVQSHSWATLLETVIARQWANTPVHIHAEHGTLPNEDSVSKWRLSLRARLMQWGLSKANCVVSVAEEINKKASSFSGFSAHKMRVIPNGVEVAETDNSASSDRIRSSLRIPSQAVVFGTVGRLVPVKGFDVLLKAFDNSLSYPNTHLVVVGDGPEKETIRHVRESLHAKSRVHLVGHQSAPREWLSAMDIYVNSSFSEGLSIAVLEAMSVGLPIICTNVGDHADLIRLDPCSGAVVSPQDISGLSEAMTLLAIDGQKRKTFGSNARRKQIERYSVEAMTANYDELFSSLWMDYNSSNAEKSSCFLQHR